MNDEQARQVVIARLLEKANQAVVSARSVHAAGDIGLASNRIYYACFYALSAVLLNQRIQFGKHGSVRAALHQQLVKTGRISRELGRFYDTVFSERQEADYNALAAFDAAIVAQRIESAASFVARMKELLGA